MDNEGTAEPNYRILTLRYLSSGQWDRALEASRAWLSREPENLQAHRVAAQALVHLKREAEAQPHLERVLAGNPNDASAHRLMAMAHFGQGRVRAADESIHRAIALNPHDAYPWLFLAQMSYSQKDLATTKRCATKALELSPRNPDAHNLLILCEPNGPDHAAAKIRRYEEALELDPENAALHNNMGTQYLNGLKDFDNAEKCFRRALFFQPTSALFQKNLFITLKHRDTLYRALCAPRDFIFKVIGRFHGMRKQNLLLYIVLIPIWILCFRFVLGALILWCMLVWPLTKVYEFLTIGDIRAQAGELGARRGGFLGYRKWPLKLRLAIFAVTLASFWGGLVFLFLQLNGGHDHLSENGQIIGGTVLFLGCLFWIGRWVVFKIRRASKAMAARKRARTVENLLNNPAEFE